MYPTYDGIPGKTLSGIHELGGVEGAEGFRTLIADGWNPPVKFVGVDADYAVSCASVLHPNTVRVFRIYAYRGVNSDDILGFLGNDPPQSAAQRWVTHMSPEFDVLHNSGRTWYVEAFNEHGIDPRILTFYLEIATELERKYQGRIHLAALSMPSGTYNEESTLRLIADHLLIPAQNRGVYVALSMHAYAQWLTISDTPTQLHLDMAIDWNAVPDYDIDAPRSPRYWTHFAIGDAFKFWKQAYNIIPDVLLTETHIDLMPPAIDGLQAGGMWEAQRKGMYSKQSMPVDELLAHSMWFAERVSREINRGGGRILSLHWFTHSDINQSSRWYTDYRHRGSVTNYFKYLARNAPAPPNQPDFSNVSYCALATKTLVGVNYRSKPDARDPSVILGQLSPYEVYRIDSYTHDVDGDVWYRTAVAQNTFAWVASWVVRTSDHCADIPKYEEPKDIKHMYLGYWWFNDSSDVGAVQDDIARTAPALLRCAHRADRTAKLLTLNPPVQYVVHRHWFEVFREGVGNVTPDHYARLVTYLEPRTDKDTGEYETIPEGVIDSLFEITNHEPLRGSRAYVEGFNPDFVDVGYIKAETLRARALWEGVTIRKGTEGGKVAKTIGNFSLRACLLNVLSVAITPQTVAMMDELFAAARAYDSAIGIRIPNFDERADISEVERVRALIPADILLFVVDVGVTGRLERTPAEVAGIFAKVNTKLSALQIPGAVFALGTGNAYEVRGMLDTIRAGAPDDDPPTDPAPPTDPVTGCTIPGLNVLLKALKVLK